MKCRQVDRVERETERARERSSKGEKVGRGGQKRKKRTSVSLPLRGIRFPQSCFSDLAAL